MDWQLHSFKNLTSLNNVYYLGGYHIEDVINQYPELNFIVMPERQSTSPLDTLLSAPLSGKACTITYGDTLFRSDFINNFISSDADVTVVVDSHWLARYYARKKEDIDKAEVLSIDSELLEFTGLVHFGDKAVELIENSDRNVKQKLSGKNYSI